MTLASLLAVGSTAEYIQEAEFALGSAFARHLQWFKASHPAEHHTRFYKHFGTSTYRAYGDPTNNTSGDAGKRTIPLHIIDATDNLLDDWWGGVTEAEVARYAAGRVSAALATANAAMLTDILQQGVNNGGLPKASLTGGSHKLLFAATGEGMLTGRVGWSERFDGETIEITRGGTSLDKDNKLRRPLVIKAWMRPILENRQSVQHVSDVPANQNGLLKAIFTAGETPRAHFNTVFLSSEFLRDFAISTGVTLEGADGETVTLGAAKVAEVWTGYFGRPIKLAIVDQIDTIAVPTTTTTTAAP